MKLYKLPIPVILSILALLIAMNGGCVSTNVGSTTKTKHPVLLLSSAKAAEIKAQLGNNLLIDRAYNLAKSDVDAALLAKMDVPVPKDAGGGYTHETHKRNGVLMYEAGLLFQITKDEKYLNFVTGMLLKYAELYPGLPLHPEQKGQTPGKLFWQGLNECVWLVYTIQGYDFVYDRISAEDRKKIETGLFLPITQFLSEGSAYTFNRIHNHGTWAVTAVGMTGYVLGNNDLVEKSLRGLEKDGKGGFLAQLDQLFSPEGYYTEGPYYQRYSMMPFIIFAEAIQQNSPELNIYAYHDRVLKKAVNTSLQLTYTNGAFFPLNDGLKEKTFETTEMIYAADIAYATYNKDPGLLDVAERQKMVTLTNAGLKTAIDWKSGLKQSFKWQSLFLSDGAKGDEGGIGILRAGENSDESCLLMKYTSHGLAHGHYDKLNFIYYDNNTEIIRDYGAARFLNIEAKDGGRYLPENHTWAAQSIAHNTITVDEKCQFDGSFEESSKHYSSSVLFSAENKKFQYMSALDTNAYPGVSMHRTMIMAKIPSLEHPVILDILNVSSEKSHQYDLPFYYNGQVIETNFEPTIFTKQNNALGSGNGYQHLWLKGQGKSKSGNTQVTWLINNRFYTLTALTDINTEMLFTTIGASDPNFNLRNESAIMLRHNNSGNHLFVNVIEPHGEFNPIDEYTKGGSSQIEMISGIIDGELFIVNLKLKNGQLWEVKAPANANIKKAITYRQLK